MPRNFKFILGFIAILIAAWIFLGYKVLDIRDKEEFYGFYVGERISDHSLTSHSGDRVTLSSLNDEILIVNFGFTNCPDICPTTLAQLRQVYEKMGDNRNRVKIAFITVDPDRDTTERLAQYISYFHSDFVGLTGTTDQIERVSGEFNVHFFKENIKSETDYHMSHNSSVFVVDRKMNVLLKYPQGMVDPERIVQDINRIL